MNPYLEDPALWGGVHHLLMSALHQQLNQRLPEGYVALVEERVYLETSDAFQHYVPDVLVARRREPSVQTPAPTAIADPPCASSYTIRLPNRICKSSPCATSSVSLSP
jgi:hypothetical protein